MHKKNKDKLRIAMLGHKRIPSREGGICELKTSVVTFVAKKG